MKIFPNSFSKTFEFSYEEKGDEYLLKLTIPENSKGIIYRVTAVLFAHGWDILEANFEIIPNGKVFDVFRVKSLKKFKMTDSGFDKIKTDLKDLFEDKFSVSDYLENFDLPLVEPSLSPPVVRVFNPEKSDSTVLDIKTKDRPGLLFEISQLLYLLDVDILSVTALSDEGIIRDTFLLRKDPIHRLDPETMDKLQKGLMGFL